MQGRGRSRAHALPAFHEEMNGDPMKRSVCVFVMVALGSFSAAGKSDSTAPPPQAAAPQVARTAPVSAAATATCAFTFTSGANDSFLKYCVTANGNVVQFETPLGHEHIAHGVPGEGYGFCDINTRTEYFDYSFFGDSPNWGDPTVVNQNTNSVKIARTTIDGVWTLTQMFTQVAGTSPFVKV